MARILTLVVAVAMMAGCGGDSQDPLPKHGTNVSKDTMGFGRSWPLSVDRGTVYCVESHGPGHGAVIFVTKDGKRYALNGNATKLGKYRDVREIWLEDELNPGAMLNITGLTGRGLKLCK